MTVLQLYLLEINIAAFVLCVTDKACAGKNLWRVSESALMLSAVLGGAGGLLMGMLLFRHKTQHKKFSLGVPVILLIHLFLLWLFVY